VRAWVGQYREELILNFTVIGVSVWGVKCRLELILNVIVLFFFLVSLGGNIERN